MSTGNNNNNSNNNNNGGRSSSSSQQQQQQQQRPKSLPYSQLHLNYQLQQQLQQQFQQKKQQQQQQQSFHSTPPHIVNTNRFSLASTYDLWNPSVLSSSPTATTTTTTTTNFKSGTNHFLTATSGSPLASVLSSVEPLMNDEGLSSEVIHEREQYLIQTLGLEENFVDNASTVGTNAAKTATTANLSSSSNNNGFFPAAERKQHQRFSYDFKSSTSSAPLSKSFGATSQLQRGGGASSTSVSSSGNSSNNNNSNNRASGNYSNNSSSNNGNNSSNYINEHYLQKFVSNSANSKKTYKFRNLYLQWCEYLERTPTTELVRSLKNTIRNQTPFQRLSICHAGVDDDHVKALVNTLLGVSVNNPSSKTEFGTDDTFDVNEILLNHNEITNEGCILLCNEVLNKSNMNAKITSVELFGNKLSDESCDSLSQMLQLNTNLRRLKLGDNNIGPIGAGKLAEGLKLNRTLTQLHLGGNKIEVDGLKAISEALLDNKTLTSLGLRDNDVGPDGIKYLADTLAQDTCALSDIQLKGNRIGAQGATYLSSALNKNKSLKVLELQSNVIGPLGVRALCTALKENTSVHALNFNDNDLADDGSESVATLLQENPSITTLGLANNRIRKKGASSLARALEFQQTAITGLDLGSNEIGNGGAVALAKALKSNVILTSLDLRSCEIHLKGILALADMANVNNTLRHLDLGANYAKNHGAIAWAGVLSTNKSLTRLCLTDNQIYHEGGEALATGLQTNYTLRNFSYGGQGVSANRIDSTIRRIIDSIVSENKRHWESVSGGNPPSSNGETQEMENVNAVITPFESNNQYRFVNVSKMLNGGSQQTIPLQYSSSTTNKFTNKLMGGVKNTPGNRNSLPVNFISSSLHQQQQQPQPQQQQLYGGSNALRQQPQPQQSQQPIQVPNKRSSFNGGANFSLSPNIQANLPNWFTSTAHLRVQNQIDPTVLDSRLEFVFKNQLLKAENPKFKGHYFIGNVINTLRKVFPEIRIDEVGLVQFAYSNPKYYVHLSREMVKTQIKYLGDGGPLEPHYQSPVIDGMDDYNDPNMNIRRRPMSLNLNNTGGSFFSQEAVPPLATSSFTQPMQSSSHRGSGDFSGVMISPLHSPHRLSGDFSSIHFNQQQQNQHHRSSVDFRDGFNNMLNNPPRSSGDFAQAFARRTSGDFATTRASGDYSNLAIQAMTGQSPRMSGSPRMNGDFSSQLYNNHRSSEDFTASVMSSNPSSGDYSNAFANPQSLLHNPHRGSIDFRGLDGFSNLINGQLQQQQQQQQKQQHRGSGSYNHLDWGQHFPSDAQATSGDYAHAFNQRASGDYSHHFGNNNTGATFQQHSSRVSGDFPQFRYQ